MLRRESEQGLVGAGREERAETADRVDSELGPLGGGGGDRISDPLCSVGLGLVPLAPSGRAGKILWKKLRLRPRSLPAVGRPVPGPTPAFTLGLGRGATGRGATAG